MPDNYTISRSSEAEGGSSMKPLKFLVVGEEDYAFGVDIDSAGEYVVTSGTYATEPPRNGRLTEEQMAELVDVIDDLGIPEPHPLPEGAKAFEAKLTIGEGDDAVTYPFWEGAMETDVKLKKLVRLLETY